MHNGQISEKSKVENEGGHNRIFHTSVNQMDIGTMKAQMILSSKRLSKTDIYFSAGGFVFHKILLNKMKILFTILFNRYIKTQILALLIMQSANVASHSVGELKDFTNCSVWTKTIATLITSSVGGAGVDPPSSKMDTFFLRSIRSMFF